MKKRNKTFYEKFKGEITKKEYVIYSNGGGKLNQEEQGKKLEENWNTIYRMREDKIN